MLDGVETKEDCCRDSRNRWINQKYNFDNLGQALMALFVLSSKDGWVNIMYTGLDAVGVDRQVGGVVVVGDKYCVGVGDE